MSNEGHVLLKGEIHGHPISYNCFQLSALATYLNQTEVTNVEVGMTATGLDTKNDTFLAMNPQHCIPTFKEADGWSIWESTGIMRYLVKHSGSQFASLLGTDAREQARVDMALVWRSDYLMKMAGPMVYAKYKFSPKAPTEEEAEGHLKALKEQFEILENSGHYFKGNSFICGSDNLTIADFQVYSALVFIQNAKIIEFPQFLVDYMARVEAAVPAFKTARGAIDGYAASLSL